MLQHKQRGIWKGTAFFYSEKYGGTVFSGDLMAAYRLWLSVLPFNNVFLENNSELRGEKRRKP